MSFFLLALSLISMPKVPSEAQTEWAPSHSSWKSGRRRSQHWQRARKSLLPAIFLLSLCSPSPHTPAPEQSHVSSGTGRNGSLEEPKTRGFSFLDGGALVPLQFFFSLSSLSSLSLSPPPLQLNPGYRHNPNSPQQSWVLGYQSPSILDEELTRALQRNW